MYKMGTQIPSPKGAQPQFSAHICCGQMAAWIKMPLGMEVALGTGDFVLDGNPLPLSKRGGGWSPHPKFSAHVYCGKTVGWIEMVLGTEVGLSPGDFVLDWDPAFLPKKGAEPPSPIFGPFLLWTNGWMHQDATWDGGRPQPRGLCVRWKPSLPPKNGGGTPKFSAQVYCGQTAGWIKTALGTEVALSPGDFVLDGDPACTLPKRGRSPRFSGDVYCGQTAAWIKMPLGTEVGLGLGLGPDDIVLDKDPASPR